MILRIIIVVGLIALIAGGYVIIRDELTARTETEYKSIALVIAETSVAAELYRNDSDSFLIVRDSILNMHQITINELDAFKEKMKDKHRQWEVIWDYVSYYTDSLVNEQRQNMRAKSDSATDSTVLPLTK